MGSSPRGNRRILAGSALLVATLGVLGASASSGPASAPLRQRASHYVLALQTIPDPPRAGQVAELRVSVASTDGDGGLEPVPDADLVLTWKQERTIAVRVLHPLAVAGTYGAHLTPSAAGPTTVAVGRRSGKPGMDATFALTAAPPALPVAPPSPDGGADPGPDARGAPLASTMRTLGELLLAEDAQLAEPRPELPSAEAIARSMAASARMIAGHAPAAHRKESAAFDAEASGLVRTLDQLASAPTRARLTDVQQNHCLRCHAQFRWSLTRDLSHWPALAGSAADGGR